MKTRPKNDSVFVDEELYRIFAETFGNDKKLLKEALDEANRAFAVLREELDWVNISFDAEQEHLNQRF